MRPPLEPGSEELRALFPGTERHTYVDTASYGLPPQATIAALEQALSAWSGGEADWRADWDLAGDACRSLFARLVHADEGEIALMPAVSVGAGLVAASLRAGDEVVVPDDEFRSILFPLLSASAAWGASIRRVPFERLADEIGPRTTLVATSHVRSNGGAVQDLEAVGAAARRHGARVLVDATHSAGVLDVDVGAFPVDYLVAAAYKHLLCPRGVAFLYAAEEVVDSLPPIASSWRSAADPYGGYYGGDLTDLAPGAARYDVSLAWHAWAGARESLTLLAELDATARQDWSVGLATACAEALGVTPTGSSLVGFAVGDPAATRRALESAGVVASFPRGGARLSFHVYNDRADVEAAVAACGPHVSR
ncbi:aminotransferase class V-fold PLP-dependent enzyme [Gaiella sp.]|uniref:aminotransferase class V-fold PLP-dependent enzyme n=1 Tax=Gaiella sp. TaxID=2663207 RepID=UPI002E3574B6|nr:aminotransferase class V-fold PLP-dependent enzyme [Gaiella sp.]HEX5582649.1 aminotransferase class V-fold PLP-dependent enzyme [Gaiella sp.]